MGIAVTQSIKLRTSEINLSDFPCKINESLKQAFLKNLDTKVLLCGNLFSCGEHGFLFTEDISKEDGFKMLSQALLELRKTDTTDKPSFIMIKEFWPSSHAQIEPFKNQKFKEFSIDHNMILVLNPKWKTFQDYLGSLKTKIRSRAKKVLKNSEAISVKNMDVAAIKKHKRTINDLYLSVLDKADFKVGKLNAAAFKKLKENLSNSFVFTGYFLENEMVGFTTAFINHTVVEANHIGIDYVHNKTYDIYQRMLYDYVDLGITTNVSELHLGRTAETIKSTVGAIPVEMKLYVRHGNSLSNKLLKPLIHMISPSEFEMRNPFKQIL